METDSNNVIMEKKKRGRPRTTDVEFERTCREMEPGRSDRHYRNMMRAGKTTGTLQYSRDPPLTLDELISEFGFVFTHRSLSTELGYLPEDEIVPVAKFLCENADKMTVKKAISIVRRARLGQTRDHTGEFNQLIREIEAVIDDYCTRYPGTNKDEIDSALRYILEAYS